MLFEIKDKSIFNGEFTSPKTQNLARDLAELEKEWNSFVKEHALPGESHSSTIVRLIEDNPELYSDYEEQRNFIINKHDPDGYQSG